MQTDNAATGALPLLGAAGAGAALMYFLDPDRGARRRHLVADQLVHAGHVLEDAAGVTQRDLRNHARGVAAATRRPFADDPADDVVITERVHTALGRLVSHPGAIGVSCANGRVTLSGPVLAAEADKLIGGVRAVRGVTEVADQLERHERAGDVPALQGEGRRPAREFELLQENWTPTARLLTGAIGGAVAATALGGDRDRNAIGTVLGLAGLALLARSLTNKPLDQLVGVGAGREAISIQKTINVVAPVDEVFAWFTDWARWPQWMSHVREVTASGPRGAEGERTHWKVDGPAGTAVAWDAVTTRLVPNELVAWKSVEGSLVGHSGMLQFSPNDDGTTRVQVQMTYNPIAGAAGHGVAVLLGRDPKRQMDDDLARLKTTIENGVAPRDAARPAPGGNTEVSPRL